MKEADFEAERKNTKEKDFQLCFPFYGIFPTRNASKLTFVFFQLQLYVYYIAHCDVLESRLLNHHLYGVEGTKRLSGIGERESGIALKPLYHP